MWNTVLCATWATEDAFGKLELELRRGVVVLATLSQLGAPRYGYELRQALAEKGMPIEEGTLYPLLRRLETQGLLKSEWKIEDGPPRRYYALNADGRQAAEEAHRVLAGPERRHGPTPERGRTVNANEVIESYVPMSPCSCRAGSATTWRSNCAPCCTRSSWARPRRRVARPTRPWPPSWCAPSAGPGEVAARYLPTLTVIDPADGPSFVRATAVGLVLIWVLGLWEQVLQPVAAGTEVLSALGHWWGAAVISSLWWPGVLVVGYGLAAWSRRRRPAGSEWLPRAADRIHGSRAALGLAVVGILCGVYVLLDPLWLLDLFLRGRAAPAAYEALTYTAEFRERLAPGLLLLLLLNVPIYLAVLMKGRWPAGLRRLQQGLSLVTCAAITWIVFDGPVFVAPTSDRAFKGALVLIVVVTIAEVAFRRLRSVRPTPDRQLEAERAPGEGRK